MSIIDTLITDRTPADAALVRSLNATGWAAMTAEQRALYLSEALKGAYKASDLNRVNAAMDYLVGRLKAQGINVPIKRSKIPHKGGGKRLPEGHTELKWIESTGTQYIDTEVKPDQDTVVEVTVSEWPGTENSTTVFGAGSGSSDRYEIFVPSGGGYRSYYAGGYKNFSDASAENRTIIRREGNISAIGDAEVVNNSANFTLSRSLFLMAYNSNGSAMRHASLKIEAGKIYSNGVPIRDYVPDRLDSGEVGLYDLVEGKFYSNAGTGVFLAGDVVDAGPSVEYDDYTWYDSDRPTPALLTEHMANVAAVRGSLRAGLPEIPADMDDFTIAEANNIELVLVNMEQLINNMLSAWVYCAEIYSGEV